MPTPRRIPLPAFAALLLVLGACKPVEFGPDPADPADPSDTVKTEASLLFANKRETDPGPLVLVLFPPTAQDMENVAPAREYPEIAFDESATLPVPPGKYKLAYRMLNGDLRPMPMEGSEGLDAEWPVATFAPGKAYHLLVETDDGNHTFWRHDIPLADAP